MLLNDTRVSPARLHGQREGRGSIAKVEFLLHRRLAPDRYEAMARPLKRLAPGDCLRLGQTLTGRVAEKRADGLVDIVFDLSGPDLDAAIAAQGEMPLPPYIAGKRKADMRDRSDYQTVYAAHDGSVAAPTAGLHFTAALLDCLATRGVEQTRATLHVGLGTFRPVKAQDTGGHQMHPEWGQLPADTASRLNAARQVGGRIVAVGTTSLRLLESAAAEDGTLVPWQGETSIFITPGYRFRATGALLTNFHLPRSTLFMLASALVGLETLQAAYAAAIREQYRFYSYGDACLLMPPHGKV
jgi:S-adenosylmethionine:tRNA ribosyltransferase-isomerase